MQPVKRPRGRPRKVTEQAIEFVIDALCRRLHKSTIKLELSSKFQVESPWTQDEVISAAKRRMREAMGTTGGIGDRVAGAVAFYESIIRSSRSTVRERLLAQERIDKLLGMEGRGQELLNKTEDDDQRAAVARKLLQDPETNELAESLALRLAGYAGVDGVPPGA